MTAKQFDKVAKKVNASAKMTGRARRVLVEGEAVVDVAVSQGVLAMRVYCAIHRFSPARRR